MKKIVTILLCASLIGIVGCNKNTPNPNESNISEGTVISEVIESSNENSRTVTFPSSWINEGITQFDIDESVNSDEGFISGTLNEDGSVTYIVTESKYNELIDQINEAFEEYKMTVINSNNDYPGIIEVERNDDFTEFIIHYSLPELDDKYGVVALQLITIGDTYNVATTGSIPENICVKFVVSGETDNVIREYNSSELREDPMAAQATDIETQST